MQTVIGEIRFEIVMDEASGEMREVAKVVERFRPAFGVDTVPRQGARGQDMKPMELSFHAQSGFVGVDDFSLVNLSGDMGFKGDKRVRSGFHRGLDGGLGDTPAQQVFAHLGDPVIGEELLVSPIDQEGIEPGAVLDRSGHVGWKGSNYTLAGMGTTFDLGLMLRDVQSEGRQVEDLALFNGNSPDVAQRFSAPTGAVRQRMRDDMVGFFNEGQALSRMARLPAAGTVAFRAQTLRRRLRITIGGGRLVAVAAVLVQSLFQFPHAFLQRKNESQQLVHDEFGMNSSQGNEFVTRLHGEGPLGDRRRVDENEYLYGGSTGRRRDCHIRIFA